MWTKSTWQSLPASTYVFLNSLLDLDIQESAESLLLWCRTLPQIFFHSASMLSFLYAKRVLKTQHLHQRPNKQILNSSQVSSQTSEESDREPLNVFVPAQWNASLSQKRRWTKEHGFKHRWTLANFKNPTNNLERVVMLLIWSTNLFTKHLEWNPSFSVTKLQPSPEGEIWYMFGKRWGGGDLENSGMCLSTSFSSLAPNELQPLVELGGVSDAFWFLRTLRVRWHPCQNPQKNDLEPKKWKQKARN